MLKTLTISYKEYESMKQEIKDLQEMLKDSCDNVLLVHDSIRDDLWDGVREIYKVRKFSDVKGEIVRSLKAHKPYEDYETTIKGLYQDITKLKEELGKEKERYKSKGIIDCIFGG